MSLKPIEMQGSFPRSQTVGKVQEQLQQRGQVGQDIIANEHKKDVEQKRKQVNQSGATDPSNLEPDKEKKKDQRHHQQSKNKKDKKAENTNGEHPFKGKYIDFSG